MSVNINVEDKPDRHNARSYRGFLLDWRPRFLANLTQPIVTHHIPWFMKHLGANNE
jgi:hypothetical protein